MVPYIMQNIENTVKKSTNNARDNYIPLFRYGFSFKNYESRPHSKKKLGLRYNAILQLPALFVTRTEQNHSQKGTV